MKKEWPSDWKKSVFIPIYKKGDKKECENYCTITRKLGTLEAIAEKTRGVPDTSTTDRASWFQKRKRNER